MAQRKLKQRLLTRTCFPIVYIIVLAAIMVQVWPQSFTWRQKMTVIVDTPAGEVSGSSVTEVSLVEHLTYSAGLNWRFKLRGEAVVVEVAPGKYLFALMKAGVNHEYMGTLATSIIFEKKHGYPYDFKVVGKDVFREVEDRIGLAASVMEVPVREYPILIFYDDLSNPKSAQNPAPNALAKVFGPGVSLKRITLEITDEPVTTGRGAKLLPCLTRNEPCILKDDNRVYADPLRFTDNNFFVRGN